MVKTPKWSAIYHMIRLDIDILWGCKIERIFLFADFGTFRAFSRILNLMLILDLNICIHIDLNTCIHIKCESNKQ